MTRLILAFCVFTTWIATLTVDSMFLPKRGPSPYLSRERVFIEPEKRPFCNAFTGCGRKRSNLPALADNGEEMDESINSLLELSAEPAVEDLSRQIMSEAKLWEAIQEANVELNRRKQQQRNRNTLEGMQEDAPAAGAASAPHKGLTAAGCALPPCYI